jgi:arylsulfatase A
MLRTLWALGGLCLLLLSFQMPLAGSVAQAADDPPADDRQAPDDATGSRPNFLVILCDDLGYGDLACYGHPTIQTPHLDQLARQGVRLTACYASAPVCSSSRAGLMTGRTPSRVGVYDWIPAGNVVHLPRDEKTVARLLKDAGYATAHIGKWHLNGKFNNPAQPQPGDHGFDHWFSTQNNAHPSHENPDNFVRNGQRVGELKGFSCQLVADEAIRWLEKDRPQDAPFFAYVCFHEPHEPVASPPELVAEYRESATNEDQAQYFANVANVDVAVGRLMAALDRLNVADDTLVFFTSDNGPETLRRYPRGTRSYGSPGPLRGMKLWMYEGGIRVPGILRWSGRIEPGQTSDEPVCGLDVLPTFCELAGASVPDDRVLDGTSFVPLLDGQPIRRSRPLFWHYFNALGEPKAALRSGEWMILGHRVAPDGSPGSNVNPMSMRIIKSARLGDFELYNLKEDLKQQHDQADDHPDLVQKLSRQLVETHRQVQEEGEDWKFPKKSQ